MLIRFLFSFHVCLVLCLSLCWLSDFVSVMLMTWTTCYVFFFLMIRQPPRSTLDRASAASDVYKRQSWKRPCPPPLATRSRSRMLSIRRWSGESSPKLGTVSYTHLRAHETVLDLVCRLLLEQKKNKVYNAAIVDSASTSYASHTTIDWASYSDNRHIR